MNGYNPNPAVCRQGGDCVMTRPEIQQEYIYKMIPAEKASCQKEM